MAWTPDRAPEVTIPEHVRVGDWFTYCCADCLTQIADDEERFFVSEQLRDRQVRVFTSSFAALVALGNNHRHPAMEWTPRKERHIYAKSESAYGLAPKRSALPRLNQVAAYYHSGVNKLDSLSLMLEGDETSMRLISRLPAYSKALVSRTTVNNVTTVMIKLI